MKIGSIVECVKTGPNISSKPLAVNKGDVLTIYGINHEFDQAWLRFDEVDKGLEFNAKHFREVEFPPAITEQIEECLTKELQEASDKRWPQRVGRMFRVARTS